MKVPIQYRREQRARPPLGRREPLPLLTPSPGNIGCETICQSCKFLIEDVCLSPGLGCFKDPVRRARRVQPWTKLARCPEGRWAAGRAERGTAGTDATKVA